MTKKIIITELGPGDGTLCKDIINTSGRPLQLKRGFQNILDNSCRYGDKIKYYIEKYFNLISILILLIFLIFYFIYTKLL